MTVPNLCRGAARVLARALAVVVLALLAVTGRAGVAAAHAELDEAVPADGSTLASAPAQVRLTFSEPVQASPTIGVRLFRADGTEIPGVATKATGQVVVARLPAEAGGSAGSGAFLVRWRALSDDGHLVRGTLTYTVAGSAQAPPRPAPVVAASAGVDAGDLARIAAESVSAAGVVALLGGLALWWVAGPARLAVPRRQVRVGAGAVLVGGVGAVVAVTARVAGSPGELATSEPWRQVIDTASGQALAVRVLAGALASVLVATGRYRTAVPVALVAGVTLPLAGHASSDPSPLLAGGLLVAHVLAAAVWAGTAVALIPLLRGSRRDELRAALPAAGLLAGVGVVVLTVSGAVQAARLLPGWATLTGSGYGGVVLAKTVLVVAVVALAAAGLRGARPVTWSSALVGRLRTTLPAEAALLAVALVGAATLAALRPPVAAASTGQASRPAASEATPTPERSGTVTTQSLATSTGSAAVRLRTAPGMLGLDLDVTGAQGRPEDVVAVVSAQPSGTVLPPMPIPLQQQSTGRFTADAVRLAAPTGTTQWRLTVLLTHADGRRDTLTLPAEVP